MNVNITISLPATIASRLEQDRGEIPRSKFVTMLLERALSPSKEASI